MKESKEELGVGWQKGPYFPGEVWQTNYYTFNTKHKTWNFKFFSQQKNFINSEEKKRTRFLEDWTTTKS